MRWHISMVSGKRLRPDMYISSFGSSPRVVSTGKVFESFRPNSSAVLVGQCLQPLEHRHRVLPTADPRGSGGRRRRCSHSPCCRVVRRAVSVAEDGGVALDEGVQVLFGDEVASRCARSRPEGSRAAWRAVTLRETRGEMAAMNVALRRGRAPSAAALHSPKMAVLDASVMPFNVGVDLLALDALEVIAHGHVEHEAVGVAQAVDLRAEPSARTTP